MKTYNNNSDKFADWTTKKLKEEAITLDDIIYNIECYGTRDMITLTGILNELENRGYSAISKSRLVFEYNN
jgi:hypothetical protein